MGCPYNQYVHYCFNGHAFHLLPFPLPSVPLHPARDDTNPPADLVPYHPSSKPDPPCDVFLNSMIGRACLEWNSPVGVPLDAWRTVATAIVYCVGCDRVRSFDGDCAHRDIKGKPFCGGPGCTESNGGVQDNGQMDKGKGKALD